MAISSVGFPIVIALLLFWQNYTQTARYTQNITDFMTRTDNQLAEILKMLLEAQDKGGDTNDTDNA